MNSVPLPYVFRGHRQAGFFVHALYQGDTRELLHRCVNNVPPTEGPYVCFVPVQDYWRMILAMTKQEGSSHYSNSIEAEIIDDVRRRRCALVFDLCNEGPEYSSAIFKELFDWMELNQIPPGQVVWLAQNRRMEAACRSNAGTRADWLRFEYYDFFVKMIALLFASETSQKLSDLRARDNFDFLFDVGQKDRLLLCLNATPRLSRVLTIGALIHHGLFDDSLVSFPGMQYVKGHDSIESIRQYVKDSDSLAYLSASVEKAFSLNNLKVDDIAAKGNELADQVDIRSYERTFFSLITETDFSNGSIDRITEKIVKPFCLGHPAIIIGNPNSVRFLTELGFLDCTHVIDRSYENELDPGKRFALIFAEVLRQANLIKTEPGAWLNKVRDIGTININHALSGRFLKQYGDKYDRPIIKRLSGLVGLEQ